MSAVKYHINPETMRPNQCSATKKGCAFAKGGETPEHYRTKEEAREAAEKQMSEEYGNTSELRKSKNKQTSSAPKMSFISREVKYEEVNDPKFYQKLGKISKVEMIDDGISFINADGQSISFSFEGDCCSVAEVNNIDVEPIDSSVKNITQTGGYSEEDGSGDLKQSNVWEIEYENGKIQSFEDINYSNGYYGNMNTIRTTIPSEDNSDDDYGNW